MTVALSLPRLGEPSLEAQTFWGAFLHDLDGSLPGV